MMEGGDKIDAYFERQTMRLYALLTKSTAKFGAMSDNTCLTN